MLKQKLNPKGNLQDYAGLQTSKGFQNPFFCASYGKKFSYYLTGQSILSF
jgi:hypothetical protein